MIRNKNDLRIAYRLLPNFPELKTEIRAYIKSQGQSNRRLIKAGSDTYVELITLPDFCNLDEAKEYFMEAEYIRPYYTYYDCSGRPFTCWYKIFKRNEKFMAYHCVGLDV